MKNRITIRLVIVLLGGMLAASRGVAGTAPILLNPANPPGSNFDLASFSLQLPTGSPDHVDSVSGAVLAAGYTNQDYFYTDNSDGAMVMMDPAQGWTTPGSQHSRTELGENATWNGVGTNTLAATVSVVQVPHNTTIGQIFLNSKPSGTLCELQVSSGGDVRLWLRLGQDGDAHHYLITNVPLGEKFNYELSLTGTSITVTVNSTVKTFPIDPSISNGEFYFKAGDYDQSAVPGPPLTTPGTIVKFYALTLTH